MCQNGCKYSVVLQMLEVFVIHMALKVHLQALCVSARAHMDVCVSAFVRVGVCVLCCVHSAEDAINARC